MTGYFGIIYKQNDEIKSSVSWNVSVNSVKLEFMQDGVSEDSIIDIVEFGEQSFYLYEPTMVEPNSAGSYNLQRHFFKNGSIGADVKEKSLVFQFDSEISTTEKDSIGKAFISELKDGSLIKIKEINLEELDDGHLIDRLSCEIVRIHLSDKIETLQSEGTI